MKTRVEQLPIELWLLIFSYLEVHDLFQAFGNLNNYFDYLLTSHHLQFDVIFKQIDKKNLRYPSILNTDDSILNRTISLASGRKIYYKDFCQFLRINMDQFTRLQSLIIEKLPENEIPFIAIALQKLKLLRHFSIKCSRVENLLEAILAAPSLTTCQLDFTSAIEYICYNSAENSNIKRLYIKFGNCQHSEILHRLLKHMPKLKSLEISTYNDAHIQFEEMIIRQFFIPKQLHTFKLRLAFCPRKFDYLKCLINSMSDVRRFYFTIENRNCDGLITDIPNQVIYFLKSLINDLWMISKAIQQLIIIIEHYPCFGITKNNEQIKLLNKWQDILHQISDQPGSSFQIQKLETNPGMHKLEMIIMNKFDCA